MISLTGEGKEEAIQEEHLRTVWTATCLPLLDERLEIIAWYEERKQEARNALIEYRKGHLPHHERKYQEFLNSNSWDG
jgi:hypothetical protein